MTLLKRRGVPARIVPLRNRVREILRRLLGHPRKGQCVRRLKKTSGLKALDGLAVALAGLLFLELYSAMEPPDLQARHSGPVASQSQILQDRNVAAPQPEVSALRRIILSRPLFEPTRRPPAIQAQDPTAPMEIPRLSGIMVTPTEKIAVFAPAIGAPIIVNQNGRFGPFTVLAISGDSVTIKGPAGVIVLSANFSDRGQPEASAAKSTVLSGGIYLSLIKVALPNATNGQGPPAVH